MNDRTKAIMEMGRDEIEAVAESDLPAAPYAKAVLRWWDNRD